MAEENSREDTEIRRCQVSIPLEPKLFQSTPSVAQSDLVLTETRLLYEVGGKRREILLEDFIGVHVLQKPPPNAPTGCRIEINSYPLVRSGLARKPSRKFAVVVVQFDTASTFRDNLYTAVEWKKAINLQCCRLLRKIFYYDVETSSAPAVDDDEAVLVPRHLLVFINPVGGPGRGISDFKQHVQPLFDMAEINYNVIVTERQGHAHDIIKEYDLSQIDGVVLSSGDGLLYEVINGLLEREDWESAVKTPVGMLPTGSGNALCASTLYESGEEYSLTNAAFQIIRGGVMPMDIASVHVADGTKCYMTLLCNWGLVADTDIESEKWRKIGETRFILGGLVSIAKKKVYRGKLQYLPADSSADSDRPSAPATPQPQVNEDENRHIEENSEEAFASSKMEIGNITIQITAGDGQEATPSQPEKESRTRDDGDDERGSADITDQQIVSNGNGEREQSVPIEIDSPKMLKQPGDSHLYASSYTRAVSDSRISPSLPSLQTATEVPSEAQNGNLIADVEESRRVEGPKTLLLPKNLTDPVPSNWVTVDGEFLIIAPVMITHMANGFLVDPNFSIGAGNFRIFYIMSDMGRLQLLNVLSGAESAKHMEMDKVKLVDAKAYRIEPITTPGMMTLDGEMVPYGPMQAQVHKHLGRVMCRKRKRIHSQTV